MNAKNVVIGLSGGVDSAVAAYLLKEEGFNVIAIFMRNWDSAINNDFTINKSDICEQEKDYNDALKVATKLDIPLHRVDFISEYWEYVFKSFLSEIKKGYTPNPDILCNRYIKFDLFLKKAKEFGADYYATGHYARVQNGKLLKAVDTKKDQTYFLSGVFKEKFKNVLFPLGNIKKENVRKIAKKINIPVFAKKDSVGICFIGEKNFPEFVQNYLKINPGKTIDIETGDVISTHDGIYFYTIGQRKNLNISGYKHKYYVCGKNIEENILYVTKNEEFLMSDSCIVEDFNLIAHVIPKKCTAKFRYQSSEVKVFVEVKDDSLHIKYSSKVKSVTPGQYCVLYLGDECVGGGRVKQVLKGNEELWYLKKFDNKMLSSI